MTPLLGSLLPPSGGLGRAGTRSYSRSVVVRVRSPAVRRQHQGYHRLRRAEKRKVEIRRSQQRFGPGDVSVRGLAGRRRGEAPILPRIGPRFQSLPGRLRPGGPTDRGLRTGVDMATPPSYDTVDSAAQDPTPPNHGENSDRVRSVAGLARIGCARPRGARHGRRPRTRSALDHGWLLPQYCKEAASRTRPRTGCRARGAGPGMGRATRIRGRVHRRVERLRDSFRRHGVVLVTGGAR